MKNFFRILAWTNDVIHYVQTGSNKDKRFPDLKVLPSLETKLGMGIRASTLFARKNVFNHGFFGNFGS